MPRRCKLVKFINRIKMDEFMRNIKGIKYLEPDRPVAMYLSAPKRKYFSVPMDEKLLQGLESGYSYPEISKFIFDNKVTAKECEMRHRVIFLFTFSGGMATLLARSLHPTKTIKSSKLSISLDPRTGNLL